MRSGRGSEYLDMLPVDYLLADRGRYFEGVNTIGVVEPVQGSSAHSGQYLLCFQKAGILDREIHSGQTRLLIDFTHRIGCPPAFTKEFDRLPAIYSGVRRFSLPAEYVGVPFGWFGQVAEPKF